MRGGAPRTGNGPKAGGEEDNAVLLRMVIADDEDVILDGLREIVDWAAIGFEVVGCFRDGQTLLAALRSGLSVDAILSDIRMEGTSGIDIARYVHERQLPAKVVLLSGYRDFEYARQAIGYGVSGYLTKPCAISEIHGMFADLYAQIAREKQSEKQADRMHTDVSAIRETLHTWIGRALLQGDPRLRDMAVQAAGMFAPYDETLRWPGSVFRLWPETGELRAQALEACLRKAADSQLLLPDGKRWIWIVRREDGNPEALSKAMDKACDTMRRVFGTQVRWEALCRFSGMEDLAHRLWEAGREASAAAEEDGALAGEADPAAFESRFRGRCGRGWAHARDFALTSLLALGAGTADAGLLLDVLAVKGVAELEALFPSVRGAVFAAQPAAAETREAPEDSSAKRAVRAACEYIRTHCEQSLSLTGVARKTYLHPSYLSHIFKRYAGMNFKAYLTRCRMERANELLRDPDLKVYDIATRVGYRDVRHFYDVYKRTEGKTPSEYRLGLGLRNMGEAP